MRNELQTPSATFTVRPADQRGQTNIGWLKSWHSFSFGRYYDPANMGYRSLRVINDDIVAPSTGFGEHGHDNMEIITWVLSGALKHRDSTGSSGVIRPGDVQVMTAGAGIRHSEMNPSATEPVHLLQIWIEPAAEGLKPTYAQKAFAQAERQGTWQVLTSPDARDGSLKINQDATLSVVELDAGQRIAASLDQGRHGYLHVAFGEVRVGDTTLRSGDAVTISASHAASLNIVASNESQVLFFDLA